MNGDQTGSILINLVDGTRQPFPTNAKWSARIHDGRSPSEWQMLNVDGSGSVELVKGLEYFDNFFDNYTVIVYANDYEQAGWTPVTITAAKPAAVNLMLVPKDGHLNFSSANWQALTNRRPRFAEIFSSGISNPADRYSDLMENNDGLVLGCLQLSGNLVWPLRLRSIWIRFR